MRTSLALSVLVVAWTVVAARAGPTGTGELGETLPCTCVPTYLLSIHVQLHACIYRYIYMYIYKYMIVHSTLCMLQRRQYHVRPL